jgi:hypothetical protein
MISNDFQFWISGGNDFREVEISQNMESHSVVNNDNPTSDFDEVETGGDDFQRLPILG